ncbi:G5 domain-containing protein [Agromyces mediolanus]|nr:G5 domain-containing protein [Agromyces mediolanus]
MKTPPAGWYDDGTGGMRWWDGTRWAEARSTGPGPGPAPSGAATARAAGPSRRTKIVLLVIAAVVGLGLLMQGWPGVLLVLGLASAAFAVQSLRGRGALGLRIANQRTAAILLVSGILVAGAGGVAYGASRTPAPQFASSVGAAATESPKRSMSPAPTTRREVSVIEERTVVPFSSSTVDDPNLDSGLSSVAVVGVDGEKVTKIRVTTEDGVEVKREVVEETITVQPVNEVISNGTRVPPPPAPAEPVPFADAGGCDPNYEGACVPIASDVDCAGGSGNGPAYVDGPVWVVGSDIYDLDRDGDRVACDT